MRKDITIRKAYINLFIAILLSLFSISPAIAKIGRSTYVKLTLENQPKIGEVAILKLVVSHPYALAKDSIECLLPEGLELINDNNYKVIYAETTSGEWMNKVIFYSGSLEGGQEKEFVFKVRIPNGKKYLIFSGGGDNFDTLEIDLGDPEPPEWKPESQQRTAMVSGQEYILSGINRTTAGKSTELEIPKEALPPFRTEFKFRTKDRPDLRQEYSCNPKGEIPFRYLVYVEKDVPNVEITCNLPFGFEIVEGRDYRITKDEAGNSVILLYSGPMRSKEAKAFYFKIRVTKDIATEGKYAIKVEANILTAENEKLYKADSQSIEFGRFSY
ncbi:MAG: hypothetical protein AAB116_25790 [Candidatus Poribacteria bacterium]